MDIQWRWEAGWTLTDHEWKVWVPWWQALVSETAHFHDQWRPITHCQLSKQFYNQPQRGLVHTPFTRRAPAPPQPWLMLFTSCWWGNLIHGRILGACLESFLDLLCCSCVQILWKQLFWRENGIIEKSEHFRKIRIAFIKSKILFTDIWKFHP